ncbi:MAG: hypothetical protein ACREH8_16975 [Opitutaceae bacterium]
MQVGKTAAQGVQWRDIGGPVKIETFGGAALAALPVLTVRLDPKAGGWDLFVGSRLVATDLPLAELPRNAARQFAVHAGAQGARICGLVTVDENPLYEDENANGIDDVFEKQNNQGALLAANVPVTSRTQLARQWQEEQKTRKTAPMSVQRPLPDGAPRQPPGKGK